MIPAGSTPRALVAVAVAMWLLASPAPAGAEVRIGSLSVFLNDLDVTLHTVLLGAIPASFHEGLHSGIPAHVRFTAELRQQRTLHDPVVATRTIERQLAYNLLTREYKVVSLAGEQRDPYLTKHLREAQRVISDLRLLKMAPAASLDTQELYYVRVRAEVSLGGVNSWFARWTGDAAETPWARSNLLTVHRSQ